MLSLFSRHGRVVGLLLPPPHRSGYVQYEFRHQAAHALNALHLQTLPDSNAKLLLHYACVRHGTAAAAAVVPGEPAMRVTERSMSPSSPTAASSFSSIRLYTEYLSGDELSSLSSLTSSLHKGETRFGAALEEEDGMFGLPAPRPLPPPLDALLRSLAGRHGSCTETVSAPPPAPQPSQLLHPASSPPDSPLPAFDRVSTQTLHPGNGLRDTRHNEHCFMPGMAVLALLSHTVVTLTALPSFPSSSSSVPVSILLPANSLLYLPAAITSSFSYSIPFRSRDIVDGRKLKRDKTVVLLLSAVRSFPSSSQPAASAVREKEQREAADRQQLACSLPSPLLSLPPEQLERQHVHAVYETIATHFSHTRHSPWPRVESYLRSLPASTRVADVGCGNGKYFSVNPTLRMRGCDISEKLVAICRQRGYDAVQCDALSLCWADGEFDVVLSVALLHHISSPERRRRVLQEMLRVLRVGGEMMVTAWAQEQDRSSRRRFEQQDVLVPWTLPRLWQDRQSVSAPAADFEQESEQKEERRLLRPSAASQAEEQRQSEQEAQRERESELVVHRYCHVYVEGELESLLRDVGGNRVLERYYDRGNWVVVAQKTSEAEPKPPPVSRTQQQ